MDDRLKSALLRGRDGGRDGGRDNGLIVVLTGAGVSAESGIPTFRGEEGYWTVGSTVYHPQDLATNTAYGRMPREVWQWYLYRRTVCRRADPNPAHEALATLEQRLGDRFRLITQNVDGLHLRAGNTMERTYQVHGNIDFMRCSLACNAALTSIPDDLGGRDHPVERGDEIAPEAFARLRCPACGGPSRPHVLWFDEFYDEELFKFESSLRAAAEASLLLIVGTSASTNLPWHVVRTCANNGAAIVDINIADNPFGQIAESLAESGSPFADADDDDDDDGIDGADDAPRESRPRGVGCVVRGTATATLPAIVELLTA